MRRIAPILMVLAAPTVHAYTADELAAKNNRIITHACRSQAASWSPPSIGRSMRVWPTTFEPFPPSAMVGGSTRDGRRSFRL